MVRPRHDDPEIPDDVTPASLERGARNELKTLTAENQEWVARHLAMAATLIDEDPELAHRHATSAARRAGRIGIVRETLAITAYATGDYALALRELRTYRRITGRDDQLPMMVDSERGQGRPERALELGRSVDRSGLSPAVQAELAIAMSGARLDLGQNDGALAELEIPQLDPTRAFSYSPALFGAYATVLEELGRQEESEEWFRRAEVAASALGDDENDDVIEVFEEEIEIESIDVEDVEIDPSDVGEVDVEDVSSDADDAEDVSSGADDLDLEDVELVSGTDVQADEAVDGPEGDPRSDEGSAAEEPEQDVTQQEEASGETAVEPSSDDDER